MPTSQYDKYRKIRPWNQELADQTVDYSLTNSDPSKPGDPQADYAVYLPATSSNYVQIGHRERLKIHGMKMKGFKEGERIPKNFHPNGDELNYYQKDSGTFYYPWGLYSSGHAILNIEKSFESEVLVQARDEDVTLLGDSGGFQWATGTWQTDWTDPDPNWKGPSEEEQNLLKALQDQVLLLREEASELKKLDPMDEQIKPKLDEAKKVEKEAKKYEKEINTPGRIPIDTSVEGWDDRPEINAIRDRVLNWLEATADYSMTLDMPTAVTYVSKDPNAKKVFHNPEECMKFTQKNLAYFEKNRTPGATRFLNVLQGNDEQARIDWYNAVKDYDFEGWAIAGDHVARLDPFLRGIIRLRDDGKINEHQNWIHCLGVSRLSGSVIFTAVQRELRKTCGDNITISYDSSSPFLASSKGMAYTGNFFDTSQKRFTFRNNKCADHPKYFDDHRTLSEWISDEFHIDYDNVHTGIGSKLTLSDICFKTTGSSTWDSISFITLMGHNAEMLIKAVQQSCRYADMEDIDEASKYIPRDLLFLTRTIIPEIFAADDPYERLDFYKNQIKEWDFTAHLKKKGGDPAVEKELGLEFNDARDDELRNYKPEKKGIEEAGKVFQGLNTNKVRKEAKVKKPSGKKSTIDNLFT